MAKIRKTDHTKYWWRQNSHDWPVGMKNSITTLENSLAIFSELSIYLSFDLAIPSLGTYPREREIHVLTKMRMRMFTAALFGIAKNWDRPKGISTGEWINNAWYIRTRDRCSQWKGIHHWDLQQHHEPKSLSREKEVRWERKHAMWLRIKR